jgi:DASS family divalent anion:Na+ symporter
MEHTSHAQEMAKNHLKNLGKMSVKERILCGTFVLLMILWILGPIIGVKATIAALLGLSLLFFTKILEWKNILEETAAWDTFIWFATFITMASYLSKLGFTSWFGIAIIQNIHGMRWELGFLLISLFYFYSHYFFASCVAHIGALYVPFVIMAIALGTPPGFAALVLAFFSNLMGGLTHYGIGQAPILFSAGHMTILEWWKSGLFCSFLNILIWIFIGGFWWKFLGLW